MCGRVIFITHPKSNEKSPGCYSQFVYENEILINNFFSVNSYRSIMFQGDFDFFLQFQKKK